MSESSTSRCPKTIPPALLCGSFLTCGVGAGSLGSALLHDDGLANFGLDIVAAFDVNPSIVGKRINDIDIPLPWFTKLISRGPHDSGNCKCDTKLDVLKVLCKSRRVFEDVTEYFRENEPIGIVIQQWNDKIDITRELRLFVYKRKLVGCCPWLPPRESGDSDSFDNINS